MCRVAGRFARVEPRRRARYLVLGPLSGLRRKNCRTIAEHAGDATPDGVQHLPGRAGWDADAVRDDIRAHVVEHLRDQDAVLVADETGDLEKGTATGGVQRRYTGTAARIENSRVAVHPVHCAEAGHAATDREPYVPRCRAGDRARCRAAGIPDTVGFATKPAPAVRMIARALDAGARCRWVAGDEVHGGNPPLRDEPERRAVGHVPAVACDHRNSTKAGKPRADDLVEKPPKRARQTLSAGTGAQGHRYHHRAVIDIADPRPGMRQLSIRRNRRTGELALHRCHSPAIVPPGAPVRVAGHRWSIQEAFQSGKGPAGPDQHQVRRRTSRQRRVTPATLAHPFPALTTAHERTHRPAPAEPIPLTCNETQHPFNTPIVRPTHGAPHRPRRPQ
jgi:SRSO17 transposase